MSSKHKQAYPPRKRLKYKKDLPWEVEYTDAPPMKPQGSGVYDPTRSEAPGLCRAFFFCLVVFWLYKGYDIVTSIGPRDGWIGLTFVFLVWIGVAWGIGWGIVRECGSKS